MASAGASCTRAQAKLSLTNTEVLDAFSSTAVDHHYYGASFLAWRSLNSCCADIRIRNFEHANCLSLRSTGNNRM